MQDSAAPQPDEITKLKGELLRLRIKRADTSDPDIKSALDARIAQLEAELAEIQPAKPAEEPEVPTQPPTPRQLDEAERLVRQARVEKMRGNTRAATDYLKKATEAAPGAPSVLEALGDDLIERKLFQQAKDVYLRALKMDPKNIGLERKYATAVATASRAGSVEDQLRAGLSDSPFLSESDALASQGAATILSAILPGLGHIVLGRPNVGIPILIVWIVCLLWVLSMYSELASLLAMSGQPNLLVLLPLMIMFIVYIGTLTSLQTKKREKTKVDRPKPPVDLPFE
jgi:tetratricopeptide (TPR) repeat protein